MKSVFLFVTFAVSAAFACPGSNIHTLAIKKGKKDVELATIDIVSSTVTASKGSELLEVQWQPSNREVIEIVCGGVADARACGPYVGIDSKLTENPNGVLTIKIKNGRSVKKFKATNFRLRRGMGCGPTVYPERK